MASADDKPVRPAAAVARHLEWLDFALAAARDEEAKRRARLGQATDKNREKRTARLVEVSAEVRELDALIGGLRILQTRAAVRTTRRTSRTAVDSTKTRGTKASSATASNRRAPAKTAASSDGIAVTTSVPPAVAKAAKPAAKAAKPAAKAAKPAAKASGPAKGRRATGPSAPRPRGRSARRTTPSA
jgi:hypothetical protein